MRNLSLLVAAAALLVGGTAPAKVKAGAPPKDKKICRSDRESKSRIPKKTCLTQSEWNLKSAQDDLDDAVTRLRTQGRVD
ncbi:MAG: hypothetical protein ABIW83_01325 [Allosphingosinicella sp.]